MKGLIPLFGTLLKEFVSRDALLSTVKALGIFINQAIIAPVRSQQFYKEIIDQNYDTELCAILLKPGKNVGAVEVAVVQVLAQLINPAFGETYSFPWKRGPHDQIIEYQDLVPLVEQIRARVYKKLITEDFLASMIAVYNFDDQSKLATKVSVLRLLT